MSLFRLSLLAVAAVLAALPAIAADEPQRPPVVGRYTLKQRSGFELPETTRPPFWPIGWVRRTAGTVEAPLVKAAFDENSFRVTSILLGNPALAVINGRSYMEGEFIRLPKGSVRVRVQRISDGAVQLAYQNQLLTVELKRAELSPRKSEEELLDSDR